MQFKTQQPSLSEEVPQSRKLLGSLTRAIPSTATDSHRDLRLRPVKIVGILWASPTHLQHFPFVSSDRFSRLKKNRIDIHSPFAYHSSQSEFQSLQSEFQSLL